LKRVKYWQEGSHGLELRVSVIIEVTEEQILCWGSLIFLLKIYTTPQRVGSLNSEMIQS